MTVNFPIESNAILESVGHNGIVNNWSILQKILIRKFTYLSDCSASTTDDVSPASTIRTTDNVSEECGCFSSRSEILKNFILLQMESFSNPPIAVQRLCEILKPDVCMNFAKLCHQINRIISSSHHISESRLNELRLIRRRTLRDSSDSSDYSGTGANFSSPQRLRRRELPTQPPLQRRYSDTMLSTRTLKRRRI